MRTVPLTIGQKNQIGTFDFEGVVQGPTRVAHLAMSEMITSNAPRKIKEEVSDLEMTEEVENDDLRYATPAESQGTTLQSVPIRVNSKVKLRNSTQWQSRKKWQMKKKEKKKRIRLPQTMAQLQSREPTRMTEKSSKRPEGHKRIAFFNAITEHTPYHHDNLLRIPLALPTHPHLKVDSLLDSGASHNFIDRSLCSTLGLEIQELTIPLPILLADGKPSSAGPATHKIRTTVLVGAGFKPYEANFLITDLRVSEMVLGTPFFRKINPQVNWQTRTIHPYTSTPVADLRVAKVTAKQFFRIPGSRKRAKIIYINTLSTTEVDPRLTVPREYHDYLDVFSKAKADELPPHRTFDHRIPLLENATPPFGPIYSLSTVEQEALRTYLEENLEKGFIRASESPAASPILFVKKSDGSLRLCVDYRGLNRLTIKNRYPLPLIGDMIDKLRSAKYYTKLDLRGAYNLLRIADGEEWKTAFRTRYGLFEYKVMPFGLTNAPASFQHLMNHIFKNMLDITVIVYLDDILVFSNTLIEHQAHVIEVLKRLRQYGLYAKHEKCRFSASEVDFLGFIIGHNGIQMDPKKVQAVTDWPRPSTVKEVQSFLGFANFYRRFVKDFGRIARPLHGLTKKDAEFHWTLVEETAFRDLIKILVNGPVLAHYKPGVKCVVETDASDFALGCVLSQKGEDGHLHPIAFISRSMVEAELNYPVHDKEFLAIFYALQEWRHYLEGCSVQFEVLSDHRSLEYFLTTKQLTRRQARWAEFAGDFDFKIMYRPGKEAILADTLSRRADYAPRDTTATSLSRELNSHNHRPLLSRAQLLAVLASSTDTTTYLDGQISTHCSRNQEYSTLLKRVPRSPRLAVGEDGLLRYSGARYLPEELRTQVLQQCHDSKLSGHPGRLRTYSNVRRLFWWPKMTKTIEDYVSKCPTCQRDKSSRKPPLGLLKPLPVPGSPWDEITCDFIGELPPSNGYNAILVFVDRFTKMAVFIPTTTKLTARRFMELFRKHVSTRFGYPSRMVTDRDSRFTSKFWRSVTNLLQIDHRYSTAYHPQTDGQTEAVNQWLEQYIRMYTSWQQDDWDTLLGDAELCYNSARHSTTGLSPLFAYSGREPRNPNLEIPSRKDEPGITVLARSRATAFDSLAKYLKASIERAQEVWRKQYDKHRRQPDIAVGDKVWLRSKHLKTLRPSPKLEHRHFGPYEVLRKINDNAYMLDLPPTLRIHPVLPVSLLSKSNGNPIPEPAQAVDDNKDDWGYVVQSLHGFEDRYVQSKKVPCVQVHWEGYEKGDRTWEPVEQISKDPRYPGLLLEYRSRVTDTVIEPRQRHAPRRFDS